MHFVFRYVKLILSDYANIVKFKTEDFMPGKKEYDVVGLGVSTIDFLNIVEDFPSEEGVQRAYESKLEGGGPIATAVIAIARLGGKTAMIDSIGKDQVGKLIIIEYLKEGVNAELIKINSGCTSSIASVIVRKADGARSIIYSPGSSPDAEIGDAEAQLIASSQFLHLNGRHPAASLQACLCAKEAGTLVSFDGGAHRYNDETRNIIKYVDICIAAKDFAQQFSGELNIKKSAEALLESGPSTVVISNGINGSYLFTKEIKEYWQAAFELPAIVDTTGCGDCFHGAFLFGLSKSHTVFETIKLASACAALNTRRLGGRSALPYLSEALEFIEAQKTS